MRRRNHDFSIGKLHYPPELCPNDDGHCDCGHPWRVTFELPRKARIVSCETIREETLFDGSWVEIKVKVKETNFCKCLKSFDGQDYNLLNVDNHYFFTYQCLTTMVSHMLYGKATMTLFKNILQSTFQLGTFENVEKTFYNKTHDAFLGFLSLLQFNLEEHMRCPNDCQIVMGDGTMVSTERHLFPCVVDPSKYCQENEDMVECELTQDQIFINDRDARKLLRKFSGIQRKNGKDTPSGKSVTFEELMDMLNRLRELGPHGVAVAVFIENTQSLQLDQSEFVAKSGFQVFVNELGLDQNLVGMLQFSSVNER